MVGEAFGLIGLTNDFVTSGKTFRDILLWRTFSEATDWYEGFVQLLSLVPMPNHK